MDGIPAPPAPDPTVQIIQKSFWQTKKGLSITTTSLALILFVILMVVLNYFDVIFLPLSTLPKKLLISCPIQNQDCSTGIPVSLNDQPGAGYKLPTESKIVSPIKIVDSKQFILPPFTQEDPIGIHQSFILGNTCYTITYTVPYDANISTVNILPLSIGAQIITLGSQAIKVEDQDLNLVLQLQKRPVNQNAKIEAQKCPVYNIDPKDFGAFEKIQSNIFR